MERLLKKTLPAYKQERKSLYKELAQIDVASREIILSEVYNVILNRDVSREGHRYDDYWNLYKGLQDLLQQVRNHPLVLKVPDIVLFQPSEYHCKHNRRYKNCITLGPLRSQWVTAKEIAKREESLATQSSDTRHMKAAKRYRRAVSRFYRDFKMKAGESPKDFPLDGSCSALRFSPTCKCPRPKQFQGWLLSCADEHEPSLVKPRRTPGAPAANDLNRLIVLLVNTLSRDASGPRWTKTKALDFIHRVLLYFLNENLKIDALIQRYKRKCRKRVALS